MRKTALCVGISLAALVGTASGSIININALSFGGVAVDLSAGTYEINFVGIAGGGVFDAWNPWTPLGCSLLAPVSGNCWMNELRVDTTQVGVSFFSPSATVDTSGGAETSFFIGNHFTTSFATAGDALAQARSLYSPTQFSVSTAQTIYFLVGEGRTFCTRGVDSDCWDDNAGGLSISLSAIPEPATLSLLGLGLGITGFATRRRARTGGFVLVVSARTQGVRNAT